MSTDEPPKINTDETLFTNPLTVKDRSRTEFAIATFGDYRQFASRMIVTWEWAAEATPINEYRVKYRDMMTRLRAAVTADAYTQQEAEALLSTIFNETPHLYLPESPLTQLILTANNRIHQKTAASILLIANGTKGVDDLSANALYAYYQAGIVGSEPAITITQLASQWEKHYANVNAGLDSISKKHDDKLAQYVARIQSDVETRAARSYWQRRQEDHDKYAWQWLWAGFGLIVIIAAISAVKIFAPDRIGPITPRSNSFLSHFFTSVQPTAPVDNIWEFLEVNAPFVLFIGMFIWVAKIAIRRYMIHSHHATDASQRITMIETFHALLVDESKPIPPEHNRLILESIFRHTPTGDVDDASPVEFKITNLKP